uniref:Uncharacterized protein n=1 Tax=Physcomitrium patens TaxID=3218 RepID=A0A2K1K3M0_PHYPA|nr:hypothetical protein PHYPA_012845 [Physcomitrium patens]
MHELEKSQTSRSDLRVGLEFRQVRSQNTEERRPKSSTCPFFMNYVDVVVQSPIHCKFIYETMAPQCSHIKTISLQGNIFKLPIFPQREQKNKRILNSFTHHYSDTAQMGSQCKLYHCT